MDALRAWQGLLSGQYLEDTAFRRELITTLAPWIVNNAVRYSGALEDLHAGPDSRFDDVKMCELMKEVVGRMALFLDIAMSDPAKLNSKLLFPFPFRWDGPNWDWVDEEKRGLFPDEATS